MLILGTVRSFFDNLLVPVGGGRPRRKTVTKIEDRHPQGTPSGAPVSGVERTRRETLRNTRQAARLGRVVCQAAYGRAR